MRAQGYDEVSCVHEYVPVVFLKKTVEWSFPARWVTFVANISTALNLSPKSLPHFRVGGFAGSSGSTTGFSPKQLSIKGF
jgi:hypothetical protein